MEDSVSYHFSTVKQRRENRHEIDFQLAFRQQPKQSRMCGVGEKADRRPIDPPPIVQLRVIDPLSPPSEANAYLQNPYYFMYASLMAADLEEEVHLLRDGKTRSTTGSVVSSLYHLKDTNNTDAGFFVFPDLSVRMEGKYRLKLSLFEIIGKEVLHCKSILSDQFIVYSAKKFPGMEESTFLSRSFADQGLKIRIRKELRQRRKAGKRPESDDESPNMQARIIDKRPRQEQPQQPHLHHHHHNHHHMQHPSQTDSIVPVSISTTMENSAITSAPPLNAAASSILDIGVPPHPSPQGMYSMQSSYGERPSTYFDPNDVELHWAGSSTHQQHQQQQSQQQQQQLQPQRSWSLNTTDVSPVNQLYINTSVAADQSRRYSSEVYTDPLHQQSQPLRQYHTQPPPPAHSYTSHASTYSSTHPPHHASSYSFMPQSTRPPDPYPYSNDTIHHHLRIKQEQQEYTKGE